MTYALSLLKDKPRGLWLLDAAAPTIDSPATAGQAVAVGTPTSTTAALVANGGTSPNVTGSIAYKFPKRIYVPGYEKTAFSLEAWVLPASTTGNLVSHLGQQDGIGYQNGKLTFTIKFVNSVSQIVYDVDAVKNMHVVGTYTPQGITLYVNGEMVKQLDLTPEQREDTFATATDPTNFYAGGTGTTGDFYLQGVAVYEYPLSVNQVQVHYKSGRDTVNPDDIPAIYGGANIDISDSKADVFLREFIGPTMSWHLGGLENLAIDSNGWLVQQYVDDVQQSGTWSYSFDTGYGDGPVAAVRLGWEGSGSFAVQTSVDGTTWVDAVNNCYVTTIPESVTLENLFIRVVFSENGGGILKNLDITGFRTNSLYVPNRAVLVNNNSQFREEFNPLEYRTDTGLKLETGTAVIIAASTEEGYVGDFTWEYWFYSTDPASVGASVPGATAAYVNGVQWFSSLPANTWMLVHFTSPTVIPYLQIIGNCIVGRAAVYPKALTAAESKAIYDQYTGKLKMPVDNTGTITVSSPTVKAYSSDWVQQSAG